MVDSEKLSLCCSDVGRYLLLGGRDREEGEDRGKERGRKEERRDGRE